jgi:hypothetical protein
MQAAYQGAQGRWGNADLTLPALLFAFAAGMALAAISVAVDGREHRSLLVRAVRTAPSTCWLLALALYLALCYGLGLPPRGAPVGAYTTTQWVLEQGLGALVGVLLIVPAVFGDNWTGLPAAVLSSPTLRRLGRLAFAVYLWHVAVIAWVESVFMPRRSWDSLSLELLLTVAVSALVAWVSWGVVEKPFLQLGQRRAAPSPHDQPGDDQRGQPRPGRAERGPSRPLGIPWQEHVPAHAGGQHRGTALGAPAVLAAPGNEPSGAARLGTADGDQLGGGARGGKQVPVLQPRAGEVGGARLEQPTRPGHVDASPSAGEPLGHGGETRDGVADRG